MNKILLNSTLLLSLILFLNPAFTQTNNRVWGLEECIQYGIENSLSIRQAQTGITSAEWNLKQVRSSKLPTINGNISGGYQFGRTIDPTTNNFRNQQIGFNSYSLNANWVLFNGNRINNSVKQGYTDLEAAQLDLQASADDIALNITTSFLNILLAEEQLSLAQAQYEQSRVQLEQTDKLIEAGSRPRVERLDFVAQLARNEQSIIEAENAVDNGYLTLKQQMNLAPTTEMELEKPPVLLPEDANPDEFRLNEIYTGALDRLAALLAQEARLESASYDVEMARSRLLPLLSISAGLNTNYSTAGQDVIGFNEIVLDQEFIFDGMPVTVGVPTNVPELDDTPYFEQLDQNFGQSVGANLSIPIFTGKQNRVAVEQARLGVIQAEVAREQARQEVKTNIQQAIANARASQRSLQAALRAVESSQAAFDNAQRQYDLGAINSLEFNTARNNLDQAKIDLVRARYQYLFNLKVIDFYQGKPLTLDN